MDNSYSDGGLFLKVPGAGEAKVSFISKGGLSAIFPESAINTAGTLPGNVAFSFTRLNSADAFEKHVPRDQEEKRWEISSIRRDAGKGFVSVTVQSPKVDPLLRM